MSARLLPLAVLPLLALAGCSKTVDEGSIEKKIAERIGEGAFSQKPKVDCPGGKKAKKGTTFTCDGDLRGQKFKVEVRLTGERTFNFRIKQ
jgi:hypothetical protein